jgi:predicted phage terminase large subunit-like protein
VQLARQSLITFTLFTRPDYEVNWHHEVVARALDRVLAGFAPRAEQPRHVPALKPCRRLMILEPPQNGKSEQVSRRFPAYAFGKNPDLRIIACSYNMSLAQDMSRDVQKIMSATAYRYAFPETHLAEQRWEMDPVTGRRTHAEKRTQGQFDIVGHRGAYNAAGVDGPITGKTADIGIIDDPVKNRAEAESEVYRDRVWEWYKSAFTTRQFGSGGAIIICLTRWHEDDLAGRLLKLAAENPEADQWEVLSLPALAEVADEHRQAGDALWPEKYPLAELRRRRAGMGEYDWAALYQQRPTPSGGGLFKEAWFAGRILDARPAIMRRARGWDTAGTEGDGDWTCGVEVGEEFLRDDATGALVSTGRFVVLDVQRQQLGPDGVDKLIRLMADVDGCAIREEKEGGSAGVAVIAARTKALAGKDYEGVQITGSKVTRSKPFRAQCEAGNVYLLRGAWNAEYIKELCGFPTAKHDDQVDASSCAFNAVLLEDPPFDAQAAGMTSSATW